MKNAVGREIPDKLLKEGWKVYHSLDRKSVV